ncbi:hypothetical protein FH972_024065 [Carpinus fangiana]|uniref:Uncharacterized protein n=1 Tax=Carpinus fangiana TaxID=176857 RepID=A0A5N6KXR8_9ROSI|nr:hypothetical protein FH972_024065 [Carpinus fangiana]
MPNHNLQETLQALTAVLYDVVAEAVCEYLAGQRRDGNAGRLALEEVAEVLKVGVAPADGGGLELERGDVGAAEDLIGGVHVAADAVGLWIADLLVISLCLSGKPDCVAACKKAQGLEYLNLEKVLGRAVDLFKRLCAGVR